MKFNWKRAIAIFALIELIAFATGCGSTISQVSTLLGTVQTVLAGLLAFVAGLTGTIPSAVQTEVDKIASDAQAGVEEALTLVQSWTQSNSTTVLGKVSSIVTALSNNLGSFLGGLNISGPAAQKITEIVGLVVTTLQGVLALLPLFGQGASASPRMLMHLDKMGASQASALNATLKQQYAEIVGTPTGNAAVDAALARMPKL